MLITQANYPSIELPPIPEQLTQEVDLAIAVKSRPRANVSRDLIAPSSFTLCFDKCQRHD